MESRNEPVPCTCPHCKNTGAKLMPKTGDNWGNFGAYDCPKCGPYRISGTTETLIANGADPTTFHFVQRVVQDGKHRYLEP